MIRSHWYFARACLLAALPLALPLAAPAKPASGQQSSFSKVRTLCFPPDSNSLSATQKAQMAALAAELRQPPDRRVVFAAHCDLRRVTREYALARCQRTADAVQRDLLGRGVEAKRITAVSCGRERPRTPPAMGQDCPERVVIALEPAGANSQRACSIGVTLFDYHAKRQHGTPADRQQVQAGARHAENP